MLDVLNQFRRDTCASVAGEIRGREYCGDGIPLWILRDLVRCEIRVGTALLKLRLCQEPDVPRLQFMAFVRLSKAIENLSVARAVGEIMHFVGIGLKVVQLLSRLRFPEICLWR